MTFTTEASTAPAAVSSIYQNGDYLSQNEDWHAAESPWKANHILNILENNKVSFNTLAEVGCGAGRILHELSNALPNKSFKGFDISPQAAGFWQTLPESNRVDYALEDFLETDEQFDVLMAIDVFEHVPDYMGFLKKLSTHSKYFIFHVPLDLNMLMVAKDEHLALRNRIGHIHYFSQSTTVSTLQDCGYKVTDWFYTADCDLPGHERSINPLRKLLFKMNPDFAVKALGGWSMMVLAEKA